MKIIRKNRILESTDSFVLKICLFFGRTGLPRQFKSKLIGDNSKLITPKPLLFCHNTQTRILPRDFDLSMTS